MASVAHRDDDVGDVRGRTLLHLQCHIGLDTLSWARRGAAVTGLDFSEPAVRTAGDLASRIGVPTARFVTIARWARTAADLVAPGWFLYLAEFHPVADVLSDDGRTVEGDYFRRDPIIVDAPGTYADPGA
ncbi:SAM-dependent methyltransferase, partial [Actinosynnema sp. NPDC023658]